VEGGGVSVGWILALCFCCCGGTDCLVANCHDVVAGLFGWGGAYHQLLPEIFIADSAELSGSAGVANSTAAAVAHFNALERYESPFSSPRFSKILRGVKAAFGKAARPKRIIVGLEGSSTSGCCVTNNCCGEHNVLS
jgi:hypothetical protein